MAGSNNAVRQANALGQSIWLDSISREMISSGELARLVDIGISGVTSNPTIFEKALLEGDSYDAALRQYARAGGGASRVFEALAVEDIRDAADILRQVYDHSGGRDGFVSIEVSPRLARDTSGTVEEARRLFSSIGRPNVMIKVPGTPEGMPAVRTLISEGINVNVTLLFSIAAYRNCAQAYVEGLASYSRQGSPSKVASVASFFVSRVDTAIDKLLDTPAVRAEGTDTETLKSRAGIANARLAYAEFQSMFYGPPFERLRGAGAQVQRPLWASTSSKNPKLPDTLYVDNLIGPDTVNTLPPATLTAFLEHGNVSSTVTSDLAGAREQIKRLSALGISIDSVTEALLSAGLKSFGDSYENLLKVIESKLPKTKGPATFAVGLSISDGHAEGVRAGIARLEAEKIAERIWAKDETVWPQPQHGSARAKDRLGWLGLPEALESKGADAAKFIDQLRTQLGRPPQLVVLGMGGSSMAAAALREAYSDQPGRHRLSVVDSIVWGSKGPGSVPIDSQSCVFLVASKSGTTAEVVELESHFRRQYPPSASSGSSGPRFFAVTDPDTPLAKRWRDFGRVFLAPEDVGGRFSALSEFGVVPAAAMGVDFSQLSLHAISAATECRRPGGGNPGLALGAALATFAGTGRDKVTFVVSSGFEKFAMWVEQLLAESTGKDGKGLIPVIGEDIFGSDDKVKKFSSDRVFVFMLGAAEDPRTKKIAAAAAEIESAGHPVIVMSTLSADSIGGEFFKWEFATAVAAHMMGVYPFDEPDVAFAKRMTAESLQRGWARAVPERTLHRAIEWLLNQRRNGDYLTVGAFVPESKEFDDAIARLREGITGRFGIATTSGYGPRYLHSTGQLHKGGPNNVIVLVIKQGKGGSRLLDAQAAAEVEALRERGRRVAFVDLGADSHHAITSLVETWKI